MSHADGTPGPAPVAVGLLPLACGQQALQRAGRRLEFLAGDCSARIDRLQRAFEHWPLAARFEPFGAVLTELAGGQPVASGSGGTPRNRAAAALLTDAQQPAPARTSTASLAGDPAVAMAAMAPVANAAPAAARPASGAKQGAGPAVDHHDATLRTLLDGIGSLAELGGRQVAQLMQRHAKAPVPIVGRTVAAALTGVLSGRVIDDRSGELASGSLHAQQRVPHGGDLGTALGGLMAQGMQALARPQASSGQLDGQPLAEWLNAASASVTASARPAPQPDHGSDLSSANQLIEDLLAHGLSDVAAVVAGRSGNAAAQRQPAPRAVSRLLNGPLPKQATGAADGRAPAGPEAPASMQLDEGDAGEALAQQINRLLLDQAWMRGVDLK